MTSGGGAFERCMSDTTEVTGLKNAAVSALADDRGRPVAPFDPYAGCSVWRRRWLSLLEDLRTPRCQSLVVALFVPILLLVRAPASYSLSAVFVFLFFGAASAFRTLSYRATGAYFLRYARCGSCRTRLPDAPDPDGLHTCEKCGAAWHPDRFIDRDSPLTSDTILLRLSGAPQHPALGLDLDDRGCPLPKLANAFPRELNYRLMGGRWGAHRAAMREIDAGTRAIEVFSGAVVMGALALAITRDGGGDIRVWGAIFGAFLAIGAIGTLIGPTYITREARRRAVEEGLCGGCGADLTHHRPMFDACVMCPACGRAWKADRIKVPLLAEREYPWREPPKPAPAEEPARRACPRCGYDMTGLDKCRECAFPGRPPRTESRKGMFPMCARCGTALPGEHRMCPRCGVMAGVRWG